MKKMELRATIFTIVVLFSFPFSTHADPPPVSDFLTVTACVGDSCGTTTTTTTGGTTGSGGGGGGGGYSIPTSVILSGRAYPLSHVSVLKDGVLAVTTIAGPDAKFSVTISGLTGGVYTFSIFSEDGNSLRSTPFTIPITISQGATTTISGMFLAPTIDTDKSEVKKGDFLTIFGQSAPNADIHISVHSDTELSAKVHSDGDGAYVYNLDTTPLAYGDHSTNSKAMIVATNEASSTSASVAFKVGTTDKDKVRACPAKGDLNHDCKVNLIDFSILAFWYKKANPSKLVDLNTDGKVTIVDFSIMAYYWTG